MSDDTLSPSSTFYNNRRAIFPTLNTTQNLHILIAHTCAMHIAQNMFTFVWKAVRHLFTAGTNQGAICNQSHTEVKSCYCLHIPLQYWMNHTWFLLALWRFSSLECHGVVPSLDPLCQQTSIAAIRTKNSYQADLYIPSVSFKIDFIMRCKRKLPSLPTSVCTSCQKKPRPHPSNTKMRLKRRAQNIINLYFKNQLLMLKCWGTIPTLPSIRPM